KHGTTDTSPYEHGLVTHILHRRGINNLHRHLVGVATIAATDDTWPQSLLLQQFYQRDHQRRLAGATHRDIATTTSGGHCGRGALPASRRRRRSADNAR